MTVSRPEVMEHPLRDAGHGAPGGTDPPLSGAASDPHALVSQFFARAGSQPRDHLRDFSPRPNTRPRSRRPPIQLPPVESHPPEGPRSTGRPERGGGLPGDSQVQRVRQRITNAREGHSARAEPTSPRCCTGCGTSSTTPPRSARSCPAAAAGTSSLPAVRQPNDVQTRAGDGSRWPLRRQHPDRQLRATCRDRRHAAQLLAGRCLRARAKGSGSAADLSSGAGSRQLMTVSRLRLRATGKWGAATPHDPRAAAADGGHHHARLAGGGWLLLKSHPPPGGGQRGSGPLPSGGR